ncbi:MAG: DUF47 family protein [Pseudomonadota bacterium]
MASPLGRLFGKSPIAPVQQHMQLAEEGIQLLCELFAAVGDGDQPRARDIQGLMTAAVRRGRELRHGIREHLPRGLLLAMPRTDLLQLVDIQQDILTRCGALAAPLGTRGLMLPDALRGTIETLCSHLADAGGRALAAIRELDEILELAFVQRERGPVNEALDALSSQLEACEAQHRGALGALAEHESSMTPMNAMFTYQVCAELAALARRCGDVGDQLDLLLAR